jgi:enoyl-CoA hydratase/carnithine racemase
MTIAPKSFRYSLDTTTQVATIQLDRPERLNALTFEVYEELTEVFRQLDQEPSVRAVLLTGTGRAFCSGGDVEAIIGELLGKSAPELLAFTRLTGDLVRAMLGCRKPIVGALNGLVAGAGAVIACACDLRVAADSARIAFLFTKVGLSGADMGASWLLPRIVGLGRAMELLLTGDFIDAGVAERIGLYHAVVPAERCLEVARERAEGLARGPRLGLEITKRMLYREAALDLDNALAAEVEAQAICMQDPNFAEAYRAFREKRPPRFQ